MDKCCETCSFAYYDDETGLLICGNSRGKFNDDYVDDRDGCDEWEDMYDG